MVKLLISFISLIVFSQYKAQFNPFKNYMNYYQNENIMDNFQYYFAPISLRKNNKVLEIQIVNINLKKKTSDTITQLFNYKGRLTNLVNPRARILKKIEYLNDTLKTYSFEKSKKKVEESFYTYEQGRLNSEKRKINNKLKFEKQIIYTALGKVKSQVTKQRGKTYSYDNEYDSLNNLIKSTYSINGKLKHSWDYSCKPEGEQLVSSKTEVVSSKCEFREENRDSSYVVYTRTFKKNIPYLEARRYTKDSIMYAYDYYKNDSILLHNWVKDGDWTYYITYNEKGRVKNHSRIKTEFKFKIVEGLYFRKNKITQHYKNEFDENGNLKQKIYLNPKKLKPQSNTTFEHNDKGLIILEAVYYKGKLARQTEYLYKYGK